MKLRREPMRKKAILVGVVICALGMCHDDVLAQHTRSLADPAYKNGVLQKIGELVLESDVLKEAGKPFAAMALASSTDFSAYGRAS